jgi:uncharacterized membrane protein
MSATSVAVRRAVELDRLRGLAIACMVVDHVALVVGGLGGVRWTVGRLALPIFFVLGGHLARRLSPRHLVIAGVGLLLPAVVPWIDSPNVLLLYAVGAALVVIGRLGRLSRVLMLVVLLTAMANGVGGRAGTGYPPAALWALMLVGIDVPRAWLVQLGGRLPRWLAGPGSWPVSVYVGHLLALQLLVGVFA